MGFVLANSSSNRAVLRVGAGVMSVGVWLGTGSLGLLMSAGCIDGTTPNCAGDAGCGPGVEAGSDGSAEALADGASDTAGDAPDGD